MKEILKYLRQVNGFSQDEIAKKIGVSRQSYSKYEKGSVLPNGKTIRSLAEVYNVSIEFIEENRIPTISMHNNSPQYKIKDNFYEKSVCESEVAYNTGNQEFLEGLFDGISIKLTESFNKVKKFGLKKGQKVRIYIEETQDDEKRRKAWETLMSFRGSLPEDFDYKKALTEALEEKYGHA